MEDDKLLREEARIKRIEEENRKIAEEIALMERAEEDRKRKAEEARINKIYQEAIAKAGSDKLDDLREAKSKFEQISASRDVKTELEECLDKLLQMEAKEARRKKKNKTTLILLFVIVALAAAGITGSRMYMQNKARAAFTEQLLSNKWCQLDDNGLPFEMLELKDEGKAILYREYDSLNSKWIEPHDYNWSMDSVSRKNAVIELGDGTALEASANDDGMIEQLTGIGFNSVYVPFNVEEFKGTSNDLVEARKEELYQGILSSLKEQKFDEVGAALDALGDYKDCSMIREELKAYYDTIAILYQKNCVVSDRKDLAPGIKLMNSGKYIEFDANTKAFLQVAAPFIGQWKFADGDDQTITYGAKDAARFYSVKTVEFECAFEGDGGKTVPTMHMTINGGPTGSFFPTTDIDVEKKSFEKTEYVGGDFVYSIGKGNTLRIDFVGESGMPGPAKAFAEYKAVD